MYNSHTVRPIYSKLKKFDHAKCHQATKAKAGGSKSSAVSLVVRVLFWIWSSWRMVSKFLIYMGAISDYLVENGRRVAAFGYV
jgi:hypothetical protein